MSNDTQNIKTKPLTVESLINEKLENWVEENNLQGILSLLKVIKQYDIPVIIDKSLRKKIETLKQSTSVDPSTSGAPAVSIGKKTTTSKGMGID